MVDYIVNLYPGAAPLKGLLEEGGHVYVGEPRQGWPSYFGATTDGLPEHYKLAYHSHDYITREWSRFFDVREINVMALNTFQDAVVARRPIDRAQSFDAVALRADARRTVEAPRRSPSAPTGIRGALRTLRRLGR